MPRDNPIRCPECKRLGSNDANINHLCKSCLAKKECVQCGKPAFKYLNKSPYHSWYCEFDYNRKVEDLNEEPLSIVRDNPKPSNPFFKDEFIPKSDTFGIVKDKFGYEK